MRASVSSTRERPQRGGGTQKPDLSAAEGQDGHRTLTPVSHLHEALVGRPDELEQLVSLLAHGGPLVVNVTGGPGAGKSALVRSAVEAVGDEFGDVQHLDLTGTPSEQVLGAVRAVVARLPAALRRGGSGEPLGRSLLVLEQAGALAGHADELVELVTRVGHLTVLAESVPRLEGPGCTPVLVGPLRAADSAALFRRTAALVGVNLGDDTTTTARVAAICAAVDGNPLGVELAAARLPSLRLDGLEAALSSSRRALAVLSSPLGAGTRGQERLRSTLTASQQLTSTSAQLLLDLLSTFSGPFSLAAVEAVCGDVVHPYYDALEELVDLRLVELVPGKGELLYRLSRLVQGFAAERLASSPIAASAHVRHADHVCDVARGAARAVQDADEEAAAALLGTCHVDAVEVLARLVPGRPAVALRLAADLGWHAHRHGHGDWLVTTMDELWSRVGDEDAPARRDALLWSVLLRSWSPGAADRVGLIAEQLAAGLSLARRLAEPLPLLDALRIRFLAVAALGDVPGAMAACQEGLELARTIGHAR